MIKKIREIGAWDILINLEKPMIDPYSNGYNYQKPVFKDSKLGIAYGGFFKRCGNQEQDPVFMLEEQPWNLLLSTFVSSESELAMMKGMYEPVQHFDVKTVMGIIDEKGERAFPNSISVVDFDPAVEDIRRIDDNNYFIASRIMTPSKNEKVVWQHVDVGLRKPSIVHQRLAVVSVHQRVYFDKDGKDLYRVSIVNDHDHLRNQCRLYDLSRQDFVTPTFLELEPKDDHYLAREVMMDPNGQLLRYQNDPIIVSSELDSRGTFCGVMESSEFDLSLPSTKYNYDKAKQVMKQKVYKKIGRSY